MITQDFLDADEIKKIISSHMLADGLPLILNLQKSKGMNLFDMETGKEFLDFFGFFASNAVGMNHPDMFEKDFLEDLKWAAITKVTNSDIYTPEMARSVDTFANETGPDYMNHFFFIDGGALAVENALKAAFDWKVRKNMMEGEKIYIFLSFKIISL